MEGRYYMANWKLLNQKLNNLLKKKNDPQLFKASNGQWYYVTVPTKKREYKRDEKGRFKH